MEAHILVIAQVELASLIQQACELVGYRVDAFTSDEDISVYSPRRRTDLAIIDRSHPNQDSKQTGELLSKIPTIVLIDRSAQDIVGTKIHADDFVIRPILIPELLARVRLLLSRMARAKHGVLHAADVELDLDRHRVTRKGRDVTLAPTEYKLLEFFMRTPGRIFSRREVLEALWGSNAVVDPRTVDVHVGRLRRALIRAGKSDVVRTVRGMGYSIDEHKPRQTAASSVLDEGVSQR